MHTERITLKLKGLLGTKITWHTFGLGHQKLPFFDFLIENDTKYTTIIPGKNPDTKFISFQSIILY